MKLTFLAVALAFGLAGCTNGPRTTTMIPADVAQPEHGQRMQVVSSQTIQTSGYSHRDMLVVKDTKTGKEYLLVQGFGAVEMVQSGKQTVEE